MRALLNPSYFTLTDITSTMSTAPRTIKTPCIGTCSTIYGDTVCRGCSRFQHEIIDWNRYSASEQAAVWSRLEQVIVTVLSNMVIITDQERLTEQLHQHRIRYRAQCDPLVWVNALLNQTKRDTLVLTDFGIQIRAPFHGYSTPDLYARSQTEMFELSKALYTQQIERAFGHADLSEMALQR